MGKFLPRSLGLALALVALAGCERQTAAQRFELRCRDEAREMVVESSAQGTLALYHTPDQVFFEPFRLPMAHAAGYAPVPLVRSLLSEGRIEYPVTVRPSSAVEAWSSCTFQTGPE